MRLGEEALEGQGGGRVCSNGLGGWETDWRSAGGIRIDTATSARIISDLSKGPIGYNVF